MAGPAIWGRSLVYLSVGIKFICRTREVCEGGYFGKVTTAVVRPILRTTQGQRRAADESRHRPVTVTLSALDIWCTGRGLCWSRLAPANIIDLVAILACRNLQLEPQKSCLNYKIITGSYVHRFDLDCEPHCLEWTALLNRYVNVLMQQRGRFWNAMQCLKHS